MDNRNLFLISDGTGISVETLTHGILTQFESVKFHIESIRYVNNLEKAYKAVDRINQKAAEDKVRPLVFCTIADPNLSSVITSANAFSLDFLQTFIEPLEKELKTPANHMSGLSHSVAHLEVYNSRINAIHFALNNDDGLPSSNYDAADIILAGVSRTGKTPTCLYLAMQYGIKAANFPITNEDFFHGETPKLFKEYKDKIFGLTISPDRLHTIRTERRPNSFYAKLKQCTLEIEQVENMFKRENVPFLNSTDLSIEELGTRMLEIKKLDKRKN